MLFVLAPPTQLSQSRVRISWPCATPDSHRGSESPGRDPSCFRPPHFSSPGLPSNSVELCPSQAFSYAALVLYFISRLRAALTGTPSIRIPPPLLALQATSSEPNRSFGRFLLPFFKGPFFRPTCGLQLILFFLTPSKVPPQSY